MTDMRALKEMQRGSEEALGWFIDKYTPYVSTIIYHIIGGSMSNADIEEVASDVFFAFWNNVQKVWPLSIRSYLGSVARNMAKNKFRGLVNQISLEDDLLLIDTHTPEVEMEEQELIRQVRQAVDAMEQPDKELFLRFYYYGQSLADISAETGIHPSTVKTRLYRGREKLRNALTTETIPTRRQSNEILYFRPDGLHKG